MAEDVTTMPLDRVAIRALLDACAGNLPLDAEAVALTLALGTTTEREADGTVARWRIEHFRPLAAFLAAAPAIIRQLLAELDAQDAILRRADA